MLYQIRKMFRRPLRVDRNEDAVRVVACVTAVVMLISWLLACVDIWKGAYFGVFMDFVFMFGTGVISYLLMVFLSDQE